MSEPYNPIDLGIEYIKEDESKEFGNLYTFEDDYSRERRNLLKKQAMIKMLEYQMQKRKLNNKKVKKRIKLFEIA